MATACSLQTATMRATSSASVTPLSVARQRWRTAAAGSSARLQRAVGERRRDHQLAEPACACRRAAMFTVCPK